MKRQPKILAGTALGLLMAAAPLVAAPLSGPAGLVPAKAQLGAEAPLVLAQAEDGQPQEELLPLKKRRQTEEGQQQPGAEGGGEAQRPKKHRQADEGQRPGAEAGGGGEQSPQPRKHRQVEEGQRPGAEGVPGQEPMQPRKKERRQSAEQPAATQEITPAPADEAPVKKKHRDASGQPASSKEIAPAEPRQPAEPAPQKPRKKNAKEQPAAEQPAANGEAAPTPAEKPAEAPREKPRKKNAKEQPAPEQPAANGEAAPTPVEKPAEAPREKPRKKNAKEQPAAEQPAANGEAAPTPIEKPAEGRRKPVTTQSGNEAPVPGQEQTAPGGAGQGEAQGGEAIAPTPDSAKTAPGAGQGQGQDEGRQGGKRRPQPAEAGPPPADDKAAQQEAQPRKIEPVTAEQGKRVRQRPEDISRRERPKGTEVLKQFGDRVIIELNNQVMVQSNERPRMTRGARDVYYEDLPRGRTRETIERGDGSRVVTVRNAYGDVVRRSRIMPDGREIVLAYVDEDNFDRVRDWRDPGRDLPPLRLEIPEDEYVLTAERVRDPDMYYDFLEQPPVERVERLYSIDEVKRSARIRDKTRRIDLDTITFEFGSASIAESEISRLEGVANAMERILAKNPAETFLIEGHTDAVGSDLANLALSDKRAESVAGALTNVFGIPPENLATQGYGEQFLKVSTQSPERQNRRVVIRRITPLVAPVASR